MKKIFKTAISVLMVAVMAVSAVPLAGFVDLKLFESGASAAQETETIILGEAGSNLTWSINKATGTLVIDCDGEMTSFGYQKAPWMPYEEYFDKVVINDGCTFIGNCAFCECENIVSVVIPDSVKGIGLYAFSDCTRLAQADIPQGLTQIKEGAFSGCDSLMSVTIPDSAAIDIDAFSKATAIICNKDSEAHKYAENNNIAYWLMDDESQEKTISGEVGTKLFWSIDRKTRKMTIDNKGAMISFAADGVPWKQYNQYVISVEINEGCTNISDRAFSGCVNLKSILIPDTVKTIGEGAFNDCNSLESITIPDSVTSINNKAFTGCTKLKSITVGNGIKALESNIFSNLYSLENVTLSNALESIGTYAFINCNSLESITIPDSVTSLGHYAFSNCDSLVNVKIGNGVKTIGSSTFNDCDSLESITIPDSVTRIYQDAFGSCDSLTSVTIENAAEGIGRNAFASCGNLHNVSMGDKVGRIDESAFSNCYNLSEMIIPASCKYVGSLAFKNCNKLSHIYIYSKDCTFEKDTFSVYVTLHGYSGSTAKKHAYTYGYNFVEIGDQCSEHTYSNACDKICDVCGKTRESEAAHDYGEWTEVQKAYCDQVGRKQRICSVCGFVDVDVTGFDKNNHQKLYNCEDPCFSCGKPAYQNHIYLSRFVGDYATCTEYGYLEVFCSRCDYVTSRAIPPLGHEYSGDDDTTCNICGETRESEDEHDFGEWKVVFESTCSEPGWKERVCSVCGVTEEEYMNLLPHSFGEWIIHEEPSCANSGTRMRRCNFCGLWENENLPSLEEHVYDNDCDDDCNVGEYREASQHTLEEWTVMIEPTCNEYGVKSRDCIYCDYRESMMIAELKEHTFDNDCDTDCNYCGYYRKTDHKFDEWSVVRESTCNEYGLKIRTCLICGLVEESIIKEIGDHVYYSDCDEQCYNCGKYRDPIHKFGDWYVQKKASCKKEGMEERVCLNCGYTEQQFIPMLAHTDKNDDGICEVCKSQFEYKYPMHGVCGPNLTWTLDDEGVLTINGKGEMYDFNGDEAYGYIPDIPEDVTVSSTEPSTEIQKTTGVYETSTDIYETTGVYESTKVEQSMIPHPDEYPYPATTTKIYTTAPAIQKPTTAKQTTTKTPLTTVKATKYTTKPAVEYTTRPAVSDDYATENYIRVFRWNLHFDKIRKVVISDGVTSIGNGAFYDCRNIESVDIPDSVTRIGTDAFNGCQSLTTLTTPSGYCDVQYKAFAYCPNLTTVNFNISKGYIDSGAFETHTVKILNIGPDVEFFPRFINVESVSFAEGITNIYPNAFEGCSYLTTVNLPESLIQIDDYAFYGCSSLAEIRIPEKVEYIGRYTFGYCNLLTEITIPESVSFLGIGSFENCCNLTTLNLNAYNAEAWAFYNCPITTLNVGANVNELPNIRTVETVTFADGATAVPSNAFSNCSALTTVNLPDSVEYIGYRAFDFCSALENIRLPKNLKSIGEMAFYGCTNLKSADLPASLERIERCAFDNCTSLTKIDIPDSVLSIGEYAFYACTSIRSIRIPEKVEEIGFAAFGNCYALERVVFNAIDCWYANNIFYGCNNISSVGIGSEVTRIPQSFMEGKTKITSVDIPSSVKEIGAFAFRGTSLKSIEIPQGVESVGIASFSYINTLEEIRFNAVDAFLNCDYFYDNYENHGCYISAFEGSDEDAADITLIIGNGVEIIPANMFAFSRVKNIVFGAAVHTIGGCAFDMCDNLGSVSLPNTVRTICYSAFANCGSLKDVTIPESVEFIEGCAFVDSASLETVNFNAADCISADAFMNCDGVRTVNIGNSVNSLSAYAFAGCRNLEKVYVPDIAIDIDPFAFYGCGKAAIVCKNGSYANVYAAQNNIKYILEDNAEGTAFEIKNGMLLGYSGSAQNVVLPSDLNSIGIDAFRGNGNVKLIEVPYNVSKIYSGAFAECKNLEKVIIPFTITDISESAFTGTNAVIYCYHNSYAYNYAVANNIDYELITVTLSEDGVSISEGETVEIYAVSNVTLASGIPLVWKSENESVASVDASGKIVGNSVGNTRIAVYAPDGSLFDECSVSVGEKSGDEVEIDFGFEMASTDTLKYGEKIILHVNTANLPEGASVKWATSDGNILKISNENSACSKHESCATCTVESVGNGSAEIKATVVDKNGNPIVQNGEEVSASYRMNSKGGFFQKIIAFFKKLFGLLKTYPQVY